MTAVPRVLQIGSGRDFRDDCLNLDISPGWKPDVVADISAPLPAAPIETARFGSVHLAPDRFDEILAFDVLEHIPDLCAAMTNCLTLLVEGGVMSIKVPYDLSLGAWQDPTHVRAFNENSFLYYAEWFWYLGWESHRFHREVIDLIPGELGRTMMAEGVSNDVIVRTPRAIEAIHAQLVKRPLDEQDRVELRRFRGR
ncbi:MAG: methyltransferase domain-containing protein [Planctomycetes bacterium]|nr:methyltransferase domain-containing protein [Planctomycetota bacterium]MCB9868426.1 methyltransferase domain-containing protein [Planctomycetota bacterium]